MARCRANSDFRASQMLKWIPLMSADKVHEIKKNGNIYYLINAFIGAYNRRTDTLSGGGDNSQVLQAINNLSRKVDEFMATQEERLREVKTKLDNIQSGVDRTQEQLAELKRNNPDLDDEISAIEATVSAIDTDVNPVIEPPVGGGETGGGTTEPAPEGGGAR